MRTALIPLLVVELLLIAVYLASHAWLLSRNVAALSEVAAQAISRIANDQVAIIGDDARVPQLSGDIGDALVFVDADKFCQALGNVLSNACKYSQAGSPMCVQLVSGERQVGVEIASWPG